MGLCNGSKTDRTCSRYDVGRMPNYNMNAPRSGSSHYTFRKTGCMLITMPKHESIKKVYVEMVRRIVGSEAKNDAVFSQKTY